LGMSALPVILTLGAMIEVPLWSSLTSVLVR